MSANDRETNIKIWMLQNGVRQAEVARQVGVSRPFLCRWIQGSKTSRKVRDYFLGLGCPEEIVDTRPSEGREAV